MESGNDLISEVTVGTKALKWSKAQRAGRSRAGSSVHMGLVQRWSRRTLRPRLLKEIFRNDRDRPDPAVSLGWIK